MAGAENHRTSSRRELRKKDVSSLWHRHPNDDPVVDGFRGISILLIILFHCFYGVMAILKHPEPIMHFLRQLPPFLWFGLGGDKAVDIFFVLSAYLLSGSMFRTLAAGKSISIQGFYLKRLARIYPLFFLGIILYSPVNLGLSLRNMLVNLFFVANLENRSIIPVGWSLDVEMQFSLILPWLGIWLFRRSPRQQMWALWTLIAVSALIPLWICTRNPLLFHTPFYQFHPEIVDPTAFLESLYYTTEARFGPLVLGMILALRETMGARPPRYPLLWFFGGLVAMAAMMHFPVYHPDSYYNEHFSAPLNLFLLSWHGHVFSLGLYAVLLSLASTQFASSSSQPLLKLVRRALGAKFLRPYSLAVFPIYLFHFPMIALAGVAVFRTTKMASIQEVHAWQVVLIFLLASLFSLGLGVLLHLYIEKPCIRMGQGLISRCLKNPRLETTAELGPNPPEKTRDEFSTAMDSDHSKAS